MDWFRKQPRRKIVDLAIKHAQEVNSLRTKYENALHQLWQQFTQDNTGHLALWTPSCVREWLYSEQQFTWGDTFLENGINGLDLIDMNEDDLRSMNISDVDACLALIISVRDVYTRPLAHKLWLEDGGNEDAREYWSRAQALMIEYKNNVAFV